LWLLIYWSTSRNANAKQEMAVHSSKRYDNSGIQHLPYRGEVAIGSEARQKHVENSKVEALPQALPLYIREGVALPSRQRTIHTTAFTANSGLQLPVSPEISTAHTAATTRTLLSRTEPTSRNTAPQTR
jgi:hypothetical protein